MNLFHVIFEMAVSNLNVAGVVVGEDVSDIRVGFKRNVLFFRSFFYTTTVVLNIVILNDNSCYYWVDPDSILPISRNYTESNVSVVAC